MPGIGARGRGNVRVEHRVATGVDHRDGDLFARGALELNFAVAALQRDLVRGEVVRFRAKLASLSPVKQVEKKFAVTFDRRYWKQGTFVYPMHVFLDPEHKFLAQQIQQIQALKVGETIDLDDGRTVQRQR